MQPKLNKQSKILKELDMVINGNNKINFLYVNQSDGGDGNAKCNKFIDSLKSMRIPLIRNKKTQLSLSASEY